MGKFHQKVGSAHFHALSAHMSALAIILLPPYDEHQTQIYERDFTQIAVLWLSYFTFELDLTLTPTKQPTTLPTTAPTSHPTD